MQTKIDLNLFEKYFKLFKLLVENKSGSTFVSFPANRYTEKEEGYKDDIYEKARINLSYWKWKEKDIGTGGIIEAVISSIELENNLNNLVDWRLLSKLKDKVDKIEDLRDLEKSIFDFYLNLTSDEKSFALITEFLGKNYPLLAYLFFIKDKTQYMPISPRNFDVAFKKLSQEGFVTSHKCSWENYSKYNKLLYQVRGLLENKGIRDVTLLNAHSFVWIISDIEEQLAKKGVSAEKDIKTIIGYRKLKRKDKEIITKARQGQGYFRECLISYWNKCSVTDCEDEKFLIASHIKPWKDSDNEEVIDVYNGLLLIPNIDKLFDLGYITFDEKGKILVSSKANDVILKILGITKDMKLKKIESSHIKYLKYHTEKIFIK